MNLKFTEELSIMTMKNNAKFELGTEVIKLGNHLIQSWSYNMKLGNTIQ